MSYGHIKRLGYDLLKIGPSGWPWDALKINGDLENLEKKRGKNMDRKKNEKIQIRPRACTRKISATQGIGFVVKERCAAEILRVQRQGNWLTRAEKAYRIVFQKIWLP